MTTTNNPKIIDLLKEKKDKPNVSLEYFPPRTEEGVKNLYARMDRMKVNVSPLFTDVTWGAGGSTADLTMDIAKTLYEKQHVANLHMTCTNMGDDVGNPKDAIRAALQTAHDAGIRNIVALRGDPPAGQNEWKATEGGFTCALDLVRFIREEFKEDGGCSFGISVAGYPEGHPNAITEVVDPTTMTDAEAARSSTDKTTGKTYTCKDEDYDKEMKYLKEKIDAGADFIITQMFFDTKVFVQFVHDCRTVYDIQCPIVPGLMCLNNYNGFRKMTKFCKTRVPQELDEAMERVNKESSTDADAMRNFGIQYGVQMCRELMECLEKDTASYALHFYTLNLEKVVYGILEELGLMEKPKMEANESDASTMKAVGSAWARVGDTVRSKSDSTKVGTVTEINETDGSAVVRLENDTNVVTWKKDEYEKVF